MVRRMSFRHPLAFLLGYEGLALHRAFAGEFDMGFVEDRVAEIRVMLDAWDRGELGAGRRSAPSTR